MADVKGAMRPRGWRLLAAALRTRKAGVMLAFGLSSGLPFSLLIGTLNAWLGEAKVNLATIGALSLIGIAYAFKFLWSPVVDRVRLPLLGLLGRRKSWILLCQAALIVALLGLVVTDPASDLGRFALFAVLGAIGSATQDIAIDAWRIDVADDEAPVELLAALYQFGYRTAAIVGGAFALFLAARMSWPTVYLLMAALMAALIPATLAAPDAERPPSAAQQAALLQPGEVDAGVRLGALTVVALCWGWAIWTIGSFMIVMLAPVPAGATPPSAADFLKYNGPAIVAATVLVPLAVAAAINALKARGRHVQRGAVVPPIGWRAASDHFYMALIAPLEELTGRLRWGVLLVVGLILTYALCYNVWASFAYPFYLDYLHYTKDEVAFASKIFGILMTMVGISVGGLLFLKAGRFPTVLVGATLPILGNFLYADLAEGGAHIDAFAHAVGLDRLGALFGADLRMVRLLVAICAENISTGLAGAAFTAYVSTVVSKRYAAVQYALLSSLTFLIGGLGRGIAGEAFDTYGYASVFRRVAAVGLFAILFVCLEWWRSTWVARRAQAGGTGSRT